MQRDKKTQAVYGTSMLLLRGNKVMRDLMKA